MKPLFITINIFLISTVISSCSGRTYFKDIHNKNDQLNNPEKSSKVKDQLEITISCEKGSIENYLKEGWKISKKYSEEKICSWKSIPANDTCDIEKDKGCKIIAPDKIGNETIYLLEKN